MLAEALRKDNYSVLMTREPGGTLIGDRIRTLLLSEGNRVAALTEAYLFNAARIEHVATVIRPALQAGTIVICDRFCDSTLVMQGYSGTVAIETLRTLNQIATGGLVPNFTFCLDVAPVEGLRRKQQQDETNDFDARSFVDGERVREGYLDLMRVDPARWRFFPANLDIQAVHGAIMYCLYCHPFWPTPMRIRSYA
jgi:dTMP kinase